MNVSMLWYDTPSGDLELGDYAVEPGGTYIKNALPIVSSTSTAAAATDTVPSPSDNSSSTTTSSESTTSSALMIPLQREQGLM
jgi:hypothetical protein